MSHVEIWVTAYNYGRFLRQCVESVLAQSHRDLSIIIVDDASSDDTPAVSAALAASDPRVSVRRHGTNRGHIATYNDCIDAAGGDYFLLLSADDFLLPGAMARAVAALDAHPSVGLVHGDWLFHHDGDPPPSPQPPAGPAKLPPASRFLKRLARACPVVTPTAVVRRSVQQRVGHYRADLPHAGDVEMWIRFALVADIAWIPDRQAAYRRHASNMSLGYSLREDLAQCRAAFALHDAEIRRLPRGRLLAAQIRQRLAAKEQEVAWRLATAGRLGPAALHQSLALGRGLAARGQELCARVAPG